MKTPRLKDVAKEAKVSMATASLVLNGKKNFSIEVRNRVYEAARRLNYIKPVYVSSMANHSTHLALLIPEDDHQVFTWNFLGQVIIHLEAEYRRAASALVMHDRFAGFKKAMEKEYLKLPETYRLYADLLHLEAFQTNVHAVFMQEDAPTAIFAQDDYLAAQIIVALQKIGRRVPEDVSIMAIGDLLDYRQPFVPRISTMRVNTRLLGTLAGEMIIRNFDQEPDEVNVVKVNQQLVERGSCQPIKTAQTLYTSSLLPLN